MLNHSARALRGTVVVAMALALIACSPSTPPPEPTPSASASPTGRALPGAVALVGPTETVWDWSTSACEEWDIPDLPARAFRDADGQVNVIISHTQGRRQVGPTLDSLSYGCDVIMRSPTNPDPAAYNDYTWVAAPYTEDGQTVYALVHNEYHGWERPQMCTSDKAFACWYNAVTLAVSTDGGATYRPAAPPPGHLVASLPIAYEDSAGPYGAFEPSNIIKGKDGAYYAFIRIDEYRSDEQYVCLLRTTELGNPSAWLAWGGTTFDVPMTINPHLDPARAAGAKRCQPVDDHHLDNVGASVTYNTYLERYVMVGLSGQSDPVSGDIRWGVFSSFSDDLLDWTAKQLLLECELAHTWEDGDPPAYAYPALIDPTSDSRNFETAGKTAYLYLTRFNGGGQWVPGRQYADRDLVRIPVEFFATQAEADGAAVDFLP